MKKDVYRGSVWLANLGTNGGSWDYVQRGVRPVVIVSNNAGNTYSGIVTVVPLTSQDKKELPTHSIFYLDNKRGDGKIKNTCLCEQLTTINKADLIEHIDDVDHMTFKDIETKIKVAIAL